MRLCTQLLQLPRLPQIHQNPSSRNVAVSASQSRPHPAETVHAQYREKQCTTSGVRVLKRIPRVEASEERIRSMQARISGHQGKPCSILSTLSNTIPLSDGRSSSNTSSSCYSQHRHNATQCNPMQPNKIESLIRVELRTPPLLGITCTRSPITVQPPPPHS